MNFSFICFLIYGFLGWLYESVFYTIQVKRPVNAGFLHGCFCPIYGIVCVMNVWVLGRETRSSVIFLVSMCLVSAAEYIISYVLELLFHRRWWDYSDWPCNINGRISLLSSVGFGILSLMQLKFIHPSIAHWISVIPSAALTAIGVVGIIAITADLVYSVKNMNAEDDKLWFLDEYSEKIRRAEDRLGEARDTVSLKYGDMRDKLKDRMGRS